MATPTDHQGLVLIEEDSLKESYTSIPNTILKRDDLSPGAKLAYVMLLSYAHQTDRCFPGQARVARDMGVGERSLIRYLKELQQRQLLRVHRQGLGRTNIYTLIKWIGPRSAKLAAPDLPKTTAPEVPNWQLVKDQEGKTKNTSVNGDKTNVMEEGSRRPSDLRSIGSMLRGKVAPRPAKTQRDWLAHEMINATSDPESLGCYRVIAERCSQELVFEALSLLKEARRAGSIRQSRGAIFVGIVRRLCRERSLPDPLEKSSARARAAPATG